MISFPRVKVKIYGDPSKVREPMTGWAHIDTGTDISCVGRWVLEKIEGKDGAALRLDIHPSTLRSRIEKLGIKRL